MPRARTYPLILWITLLASGGEVARPLGWTLECCEMRQFCDAVHGIKPNPTG